MQGEEYFDDVLSFSSTAITSGTGHSTKPGQSCELERSTRHRPERAA